MLYQLHQQYICVFMSINQYTQKQKIKNLQLIINNPPNPMHSKSPNRTNQPSKPPQSNSPLVTTKQFYYTNAIFMGTSRSLRRIGPAIVTFHDGTCAILSHNSNQELHGLCVYYRNRCLISGEFVRNRLVSVVYRIDGFLMFLRYSQQSKIHGDCYVASFVDRTVHQVVYEDGVLRSKIQMITIQKLTVQNLFLNEAFHLIIGPLHNKAIRHEITPQQIKNIRMKKVGNKVQVHFMQNSLIYENKLIEGLGFEFVYRSPQHGGYDPETNKFSDQFQLNVIERGVYRDNMLEGYGMKVFKNNNVYEGFFKDNVFHGEGCLKNTYKGSWVYGHFHLGQMKEIIDFSNQSNQQAKCNIFLQNLRQKQEGFINQMIEENNFDFLDWEMEKISARGNFQQYKSQTFEERKEQIMRKIISQFTELQMNNQGTIEQDLTKLKNSKAILGTVKKSQQDSKKQVDKLNETVRKHKLNSLVPQSMAHIKFYNNSDHTMTKAFQEQMKRYQRQKQKNMAKSPTLSPKQSSPRNKNLSKIFHKDYSHLQNIDKTKKIDLQLSLKKVQSKNVKKSRQRKSQIFSARTIGKLSKTQLSMSNIKTQGNNLNTNEKQISPFKRRSPQRKTAIFTQTLKLKKGNQNQTIKSSNQNESDSPGITKLQSIRKGSIEKKNQTKTKLKRAANPIFEQNKQKTTQVAGKFIYTYEDAPQDFQNNNQNKAIKLKPLNIQ